MLTCDEREFVEDLAATLASVARSVAKVESLLRDWLGDAEPTDTAPVLQLVPPADV